MIRGRYNFGTLSGNFIPSKDDAYDLGSSTKEFRNLYIDGTANIDSLVADTADINGGTIDGVTIGVSSVCTQLTVDNLRLDGNTISNVNSGQNIILLPTGTGITVIGDAGSTSHALNTNDDAFVSGRLEVDGTLYLDGALYVGASGIYDTARFYNDLEVVKTSLGYGKCTFSTLTEVVTIAAGANTAVTSTVSIPALSTIYGVVVRVNQAPGGGPTKFNVGITGGDTDAIIDNAAVTVGGTFDMVANGDGTYTFFVPNIAASTFTVTTTDGADTPTNVTGASFLLRLTAFYITRTKPVA
jgi:hypothetical protein